VIRQFHVARNSRPESCPSTGNAEVTPRAEQTRHKRSCKIGCSQFTHSSHARRESLQSPDRDRCPAPQTSSLTNPQPQTMLRDGLIKQQWRLRAVVCCSLQHTYHRSTQVRSVPILNGVQSRCFEEIMNRSPRSPVCGQCLGFLLRHLSRSDEGRNSEVAFRKVGPSSDFAELSASDREFVDWLAGVWPHLSETADLSTGDLVLLARSPFPTGLRARCFCELHRQRRPTDAGRRLRQERG
jgi:hypothetical protein